MIIYTGSDAAAQQTSAVFGRSVAVEELINNHGVNVRDVLADMTTAIR